MIDAVINHSSVPIKYLGVWQRQLLEINTIKDESSTVFWMQSQFHHIDIRIPNLLNELNIELQKADALDNYSKAELLLLAQQQGFAGITKVTRQQDAYINNNVLKDDGLEVCEWLREIDYQPATHYRDIGKMDFKAANIVIETGLDIPYLEVWRRLDHSQQPISHQVVTGKNRHGQSLPAYLMRAGKFVAFARKRSIILPEANSLAEAIQTFKSDRETLLDWLDLEISFGEMQDDNHWQIKYSTLPFKINTITNF